MAGGRDAPASPEPAPPELLGYHTNFPGVFPLDVDQAIRTGGALPSDLSAGEQRAIEQLGAAYKHAAYAVPLPHRHGCIASMPRVCQAERSLRCSAADP